MVVFLVFLILDWPGYRHSNIRINGFDLEQVLLEDELVEKFADALYGQKEDISEEERKQRWNALGECLDLIKTIRGPITDSSGDSEF